MSHRGRELFERLVRDHAAALHRFAYWQSGNAEAAEDLVQEAFAEAWISMGSLRDPAKGRAWIFQILRHRCAHHHRALRRRPLALVDPADMERLAGADPSAQDALDAIDQRGALEAALGRLADRYREPFLLVFLAGLTCREAGELLDVPLGTVLSRIHRARGQLRGFLAATRHGTEAVGRGDTRRLEVLRRRGVDD